MFLCSRFFYSERKKDLLELSNSLNTILQRLFWWTGSHYKTLRVQIVGRPSIPIWTYKKLNLALSDILFLSVVLPSQISIYYFINWKMGTVMCRLFFFLEDVSSSQNSLILCLTGIDRFLTVVGTKRSTKVSRKPEVGNRKWNFV